MAEPWERLPGETAKAYAAFCAYRDLGPHTRSLTRAGQVVGKCKAVLERWSVRWRWVARVTAWDEEQERLKAEALAEARRKMAERHAGLAVLFTNKIAERLMAFTEADLRQMSPRDLAYWLDVATKVERLARGEPTAEVKTRMAGVPGEPVELKGDGSREHSPEQAASILSILAEVGAIPAPVEAGDDAAADEVYPPQTDA